MRRTPGPHDLLLLAAILAALTAPAPGQTLLDPTLRVSTHATGLTQPTAIAPLPVQPGQPVDLLVCEWRTGRVIHVRDGVVQGAVLDLAVNSNSERGLLGMALHPQFEINGYVYLDYTPSSTGSDTFDGGSALDHRVERYTWNGTSLTAATLLLTLPVTPGPNHDGGILLFGPDDKLYGVIGDLNRNGQLENFPLGQPPDDTAIIFRVNDDGSAPTDNPFFALGGNMQKVYAYGVRNSYGMDFDPLSDVLWDTENGPDSYDEINRVLPGFNSGWERIMGPDSRDPQGVGDLWMALGAHYSDPEFSWLAPIAVTAIHFPRSDALGTHYRHDCFVGDYITQALYHFEVTPDRTALVMTAPGTGDRVADDGSERDAFLFGTGFGVVTDIETGADGVYVSSLSTGKIFRIWRTPTSDVQTGIPPGRAGIRIAPNPTRGSTRMELAGQRTGSNLVARIYAPSGRLVRTLRGGAAPIEWDGLDAGGRTVAAGVYLLRLQSAETSPLGAKIVRLP